MSVIDGCQRPSPGVRYAVNEHKEESNMRPISSLTILSFAIVLSALILSFTGEKYQGIHATDGEVVVLDTRNGIVCWVDHSDGYYRCSNKFKNVGNIDLSNGK